MDAPGSEYLDVVSGDGVRLCTRTRGSQNAPAILFIHGFSQSHLAWRRQFDGDLTTEFRLVAFDLRGHGWSDKPDDAQTYSDSGRWADDVAAVLDALARLNVPVLFTHGTLDAIIAPAMSSYGVQTVPGAGISLYEDVGHSPFYEDATRFNRELADFVRTCAR